MERVIKGLLSGDQISGMLDWLDSQPYSSVREKPNGRPFYREKDLGYDSGTPIAGVLRGVIEPILPRARFFSGAYRESFYPFSFHVDTSNESWLARDAFLADNPDAVGYDAAMIIPIDGPDGCRTVIFDISSRDWGPGQTSTYATLCHNGLDPLDFVHVENEIDRCNVTRLPLLMDFEWNPGDAVIWKRDRVHLSSNFMSKRGCKRAITIFFW